MNKRIFVSYRRDDDGAYFVPVLNQRLTTRYGADSVFYDIDNIPLGVDFRSHLSNAISSAAVVLVVIGDRWLGYDAKTGLRRIDREDDFVRIEVEAALTRGIPVVPILVGKATMPCDSELPPSISSIAFRNAAEVRTGKDYGLHFDALEKGLDALFSQRDVAKEVAHDSEPSAAQIPYAVGVDVKRMEVNESLANVSSNNIHLPKSAETAHSRDRFIREMQERSFAKMDIWRGRSPNPRGIKVQLGKRDHNLSVDVVKDRVRVQFWIRLADADWQANKFALQMMEPCRGELQKAVSGYEIKWDVPSLEQKTANVEFNVTGGYASPEPDWPRIQDEVIDAVISFVSVLQDQLQRAS